MPRYRFSDSESDYSETDVSIDGPRRRTVVRRRSISRRRRSPDFAANYLAPIATDVRVHRSASTSGRRRPREASPAVIVDIKNDVRAAKGGGGGGGKKERLFNEVYESEDEVIRVHRRPRASTGVSREPSPRQPPRDYELMMEQRILEKNDVRQDIELAKLQQEINRLEMELARKRERHDHHEVRLLKEEEEWYEDEINDRLRRLERYERKQRLEEERRMAEYRAKMQKYEQQERLSQEKEEVKNRLRDEKLRELQRKMEEEEERERIRKELRDEQARKLLEEMEREKEEKKMKQAAIEEYKLREAQRIEQERKMKEQKDKEFIDRLRALGYTDAQIEDILKRKNPGKDKDKGKEKAKEGELEVVVEKKEEKTTWIKVHRKHLLPETLIAYRLPWDWDELDSNYIIIKQWISEEFQEELFAHTRRLREGKVITEQSSSLTELKVNDSKRDKMYLVRKKKQPGRAWIFT